jgi:DNA invertase Pin-like site-specific DNA recombinase
MGHLLGYARVSTTDQHPQLQVDALQRAGCYRVFTETASGARADRPELELVLDQLRPGDTSLCGNWTGSGGRSGICSTPSPAWPSAASGSGVSRRRSTPLLRRQARLPRVRRLGRVRTDLIRERTTAGLAAARARGRHGGRPSVMTAHKLQVAQEMYASKQYTVAAIAKTLDVSRASIYRHLTRPDS